MYCQHCTLYIVTLYIVPDVLPTESPEETWPLAKHKLHIVAEPNDVLF